MQNYPVAKIDLAALKHNLYRVKQLAPQSRIMSVIKANAYGHGAIQVAQALNETDAFAVARLDEALRLRQIGITKAIVILEGVNNEADLQQVADHSLSLVFHHQSQINLLRTTALSSALGFCWLMVETGMHRLGLAMDECDMALAQLTSSDKIDGQIGLMTHFANAEMIEDSRNKQQLSCLEQMNDQYKLPISIANSAAILTYPDSHADWLRPGLMLYGISPFADQSAQDLGLKPVMQLESHITSIQQIKIGDQVGYGGQWIAEQESQIAIVSIGYGDGYSRQLSNQGMVLVQGQICPVIGRVSMDMIAIDISKLKQINVGDKVILWGAQQLAVERIAELANTIPYELVCQVSERVIREYHGKS